MFKFVVAAASLLALTATARAQGAAQLDGFYAGVTAGYSFSTERPGAMHSIYYPEIYATYPVVPGGSLKGASVGLLGGYNVSFGSVTLGIETRATYRSDKASSSISTTSSGRIPPFITYYSQCESCKFDSIPASLNPTSYEISSSTTRTIRLSRPWQVDITPRLGFAVGDWLLFAKAGFGLEETRNIYVTDNSASKICTQPRIERRRPRVDTFEIAVVGCNAVTGGSVTTKITDMISPVAILGFGVERNFGSYFARVEAEMTAHIVTGDTYYTPSANFTVGYRF